MNEKKIEVSEEVYKVYCQEKNHENYLKRLDRKNHMILFSSLDQDRYFESNIVDDKFDLNKVIQKKLMIEAVRDAISKLNDEERELIERLYYNEETLRSVAESENISQTALIKRRNNILKRLRDILKDFK